MAKIDLNDYLEKLTEPEDRETVATVRISGSCSSSTSQRTATFPSSGRSSLRTSGSERN